MEIINPKFNTFEEQVQTNMENIKILAGYIKDAFNATVELTPETTTIDASNVRDWVAGTTDGFILDNSGYLFKIVAVSDSTIYLQYWSDLEGPQGVVGPRGQNGADGAQGPRGSRISIGASGGQPADAIAGDIYIDALNYDLYTYNGAQWNVIGNIKGLGFNDLTTMNLVTGDPTSVTYNAEDGIIIESQGNFTTTDPSGLFPGQQQTHTATVTNKVPIVGSETIVFDATEDGKAVEAHLDAGTVAKIDRSLVTPMTAPQATQLVAIGTNNDQTNLNIGTGLTVENGTLNASGGGGSGKYLHSISLRIGGVDIDNYQVITLVSNNASPITTIDELAEQLYNNGYQSSSTMAPMTGANIYNENRLLIPNGVFSQGTNRGAFYFKYIRQDINYVTINDVSVVSGVTLTESVAGFTQYSFSIMGDNIISL